MKMVAKSRKRRKKGEEVKKLWANGDPPDVYQVPAHGAVELFGVIGEECEGGVKGLNNRSGGGNLEMQPGSRTDAEGINHEQQEEHPEEQNEPASTPVLAGMWLRDIRSLFHGMRVASEKRRGNSVSSCPFGAAVCNDLGRREGGECLECWAGTLERANAVSDWLRPG